MKKKFTTLFFPLFTALPLAIFSQDTLLYENFSAYVDTAGNYTVPTGWSINSNASYTTSFVSSNSGQPAYKFDSSNDSISSPSFSGADTLQFWLKGASTDSLSSLTILETADNISWDTLATILPIPTSSTYKKYPVKNTSVRLRFRFTKSAGNLGFDDFLLTGPEPVSANFSAPDNCIGDSSCFTDLSSTVLGTISTWSWDFGDGGIDSIQNPCHLYSAPGSYTVQLMVINSNSDTDLVSKTINIGAIPVASFSPTDTSGCGNLVVAYSNSSSVLGGSILLYNWGDSSVFFNDTSLSNPVASFDTGIHQVSLIVTSDLGCSDTAYGTVTVYTNPQIDTNAIVITNPNCGASDGSISGISVSGNSPFSYMWMPGMQSTPDLINSPGDNYSFSVSDINNCSSSLNFILASAGAPLAPSVSISSATYCEGDIINPLIATGTGGTLTWYGDSLLSNVIVTDDTLNPTLNQGENYFYVTETTTCEGPAAVAVITLNASADATINPAGPFCLNDSSVTLTAAQTGGLWSGIGITGPSNGTFNPSAAGVGPHIITNTISGSCGDTDTILIVVNTSANTTISNTGPFCESDSAITMTAVDNGGIWAGVGITNPNTGTFDPGVAGNGTHNITYTINGVCGGADTIDIIVNSNPVADFTMNLFMGWADCFDNSIGATSWFWYIGGNIGDTLYTSTSQDTTFTFGNGIWYVCLTVNNVFGCADDTCQSFNYVGINEIYNPFSFDISPNPSNGKFQITTNIENRTTMKISNILGEKIFDFQLPTDNYLLDLTNQPEGTYFVTIASRDEFVTKKIVIVR